MCRPRAARHPVHFPRSWAPVLLAPSPVIRTAGTVISGGGRKGSGGTWNRGRDFPGPGAVPGSPSAISDWSSLLHVLRSVVVVILTSPSLLVEGVRSGSRRRSAASASALAGGGIGPESRRAAPVWGERCAVLPVCGVCRRICGWPGKAQRAATKYCGALYGLSPARMPNRAIYVSSRWRRRAPPRARPPPGSALGTPAQHGRATAEQVPQISQAHPSCCPMLPRPSSSPHNCPARGQRV